ncbi:MAG: NADH-quinone oxidoreductase subunit N [Myxococcales bacterium]|nr:NADH-quinone oxidoreductase subunit N [Myxococcales bacterium]
MFGNLVSMRLLAPAVVLGAVALFLFLASAFVRRRETGRWLFPGAALIGLAAALVTLLETVRLQYLPDGYNCLLGGCTAFLGMLAYDPLAVFFQALVMLAAVAAVVLTVGSPAVPQARRGEYFGLILAMTVGMCLLVSANHLLMLYVALEAVSLCSYLLTGFDAKARSAEAGLKYALYGGVASAVMLFGLSWWYGLFGSLNLQSLHFCMLGSPALSPGESGAAVVALLFILAGFGFKIAAVPFHQWCPDAYEGAPTPIAALLSVAPKLSGFAVLLRFAFNLLFDPRDPETLAYAPAQLEWALWAIAALSALSMTIGNLAAIPQNNLKRLLAYSSIAHAGYLLMGVVGGSQGGIAAVSLYGAVYLVMNLGAFAVVAAVERATGSEDLLAFHGLAKRSPLLAVCMAVFLLALTGLPPTAGFVGKVYLFASLLKGGGSLPVILAVVGIVNTVISLYFYARVLRAMFLLPPEPGLPERIAPDGAGLLAAALAVLTLALGVFFGPLAMLAEWSAGFVR